MNGSSVTNGSSVGHGLGRAVESIMCKRVFSYEWVLSWLQVLRRFSYVWLLRVFADFVYLCLCPFIRF